MSKEEQVKKLTDQMAKFIAYTAKKLPDDVIAKLEELREKEDIFRQEKVMISIGKYDIFS